MGRQGSQESAFTFQTRDNGIRAPSHNPLLIVEAVLAKLCVDGFQVSALWKGHEVVTARIADQVFDAAFLPPGMHIGKERDLRDRHCGSAETRRARVDYVLAAPGARLV